MIDIIKKTPALSTIHTRITLPREDPEDYYQNDGVNLLLTVERLPKRRIKIKVLYGQIYASNSCGFMQIIFNSY